MLMLELPPPISHHSKSSRKLKLREMISKSCLRPSDPQYRTKKELICGTVLHFNLAKVLRVNSTSSIQAKAIFTDICPTIPWEPCPNTLLGTQMLHVFHYILVVPSILWFLPRPLERIQSIIHVAWRASWEKRIAGSIWSLRLANAKLEVHISRRTCTTPQQQSISIRTAETLHKNRWYLS